MPSSHIGSEAMLIWMKYPAWSMISVSGAVRTMRAPPATPATGADAPAWLTVSKKVASAERLLTSRLDSALGLRLKAEATRRKWAEATQRKWASHGAEAGGLE